MNPYLTNPYTGQQYFTMQQPIQTSIQQPIQQTQQIQNGGFISVRNMEEARNYPIAPGNSITFKDETAPYVYTKTMGFSQLDRPVFEKFRLVKEDDPQPQTAALNQEANSPDYALKADLEEVSHTVDKMKDELENIRKELEAGV